MAVQQRGPEVASALDRFRRQYARVQDRLEAPVDRIFKRELIGTSWTKTDEGDKATITDAVRNRKAFDVLQDAYTALSELGFADPQAEAMLSQMRVPDCSSPDAARLGGIVENVAQLPPALKHVTIRTMGFASITVVPDSERKPGSVPEEVLVMESAVKCRIMDVLMKAPAHHQQLKPWLSNHFPGLDDILDSIRGADHAFIVEAMTETRDKAIKNYLLAPSSHLEVLVADERRAAAARVDLHAPRIASRTASISAERHAIEMAEARLRDRARLAIAAVVRASKMRSDVGRTLVLTQGAKPRAALHSMFLRFQRLLRSILAVSLGSIALTHDSPRATAFRVADGSIPAAGVRQA